MLDELSPQEKTRWEKEAGTLILVPLIGRTHFLGGIAGLNKRAGGDFTQRDLDVLTLFAGQVAIAIENAMAMQKMREAQQQAEEYQARLQQLNNRLALANQELEYLSLYDPLTGLPNRSLLRDRLQAHMALSDKTRPVALLLIDLDHFQDVNDSLGHDEGDRLIKTVAARFAALARPADTIGRIGGDEFLGILPQTDGAAAVSMAHALQQSLKQAVPLGEHEVAMTASIGIALYPEHGDDVTTLLKHADAALYAAKQNRNEVRLYDSAFDAFAVGRLALFSDLQIALQQQEFQLYYQPKLALASDTIVGFEALARWPHKERGFVPAEMFVSAMEQTGLIYDFSLWVIETAARQCSQWQRQGWAVQVAVNLPVTVILEPRFLPALRAILARHGVRGGLTFEITESLFLSDYDRLSALLNEMRLLGVSFSIDDFGTGHSSLSRLRKLPVSELKIDRSFVMDMEKNKDDLAIVESTINLAHNLGLDLVAEGVESAQVLAHLMRLDCDLVQGYHISRPLTPEAAEAFIRHSGYKVASAAGAAGSTGTGVA